MYLPAIQPAFVSIEPNQLFVPKQIEEYTRNFLHRYVERPDWLSLVRYVLLT